MKKSLKYDFSFTNWGEATDRWLKGVKKRNTTLFPEVSKQARILAGIKVKPTDTGTESLSSESGSDSSGRDLDSNYDGLGKGTDDNHQNNAGGNGWNGDYDDEHTDAGNHRLGGGGDNEDGGQQELEGNDGHGNRQSDNEADNEQEDEGPGGHDEDDGEGSAGDEVVGDDDYEMLVLEEPQELSESDLYDSNGEQMTFIVQLR